MKVTQKIIESVIGEVIGPEVFPLVNVLKDHKNISEFEISAKVKTPVDIIRNYLYRLYNNNLVTFTRKKDKKKGWYIYYWNLNPDRIKYLVSDLKRKKLEKLRERLLREKSNHFFVCSSLCIRVDFEQATNFEFKCPECGELLNQEDNREKIITIEKDIVAVEKDLSNEISVVEDKDEPDESEVIRKKRVKKVNSLKKKK
jgi:transcription initiation factor TFIIE subunit alpha